MADLSEDLLSKFVRTYTKSFTLKEMKKVLSSLKIKATTQEIVEFLAENPNVLELANGSYITRAGAFTGEIFSIVPTASEVSQGVFVPGHRCMPFVESDRISSSLSFFANGKKIPMKVGEFSADDAIDMFMLYGEEYAPLYIAADPANAELNLAQREFELPNKVRLTGFDLGWLSEKFGYKKGDRILCCVTDWDRGFLNIMILHTDERKFDKGEVGEKRIEWFGLLEKKLLESFEIHGPMGAIEDQLTNLFFENRSVLCVPYCGSMEEYINQTARKIGICTYGVESRLWKKGEDVPAFGSWNSALMEMRSALKNSVSFSEFILSSVPDYVFDQLVLDCLFRREKDLVTYVMNYICRDEITLDKSVQNTLSLNLKGRNAILSKNYNWFADQALGPLRSKILDLYGKVWYLVRQIDYMGESVSTMPSHEVVILAQLNNHILRMIDTVANDPEAEEGVDAMLLSLDGMDWNFEEIRGTIESALRKAEMSHFQVLK